MGRSGVPEYRRHALEAYESICAHCGFGIDAVLEVALGGVGRGVHSI